MRNVVILISSMALLLTVAIATSRPDVARATTLGTLTVSDDLRISQSDPAAPTPVIAQVEDLFGAAPTELDGRVTTYDIGDGTFSATGPTWNTIKNKVTDAELSGRGASSGGTATRTNSGANLQTFALVPWLTRRSQITVDLLNLSNAANRRPDAGVVLNAAADGSSGIAAVATCVAGGACTVGLYTLNSDGTSKTLCGSTQALSTSSPTEIDIALTYEPNAAGNDASAVFTRTGGGGGTNPSTRTCEPSVLTGRYAGLYSNLEGQTAVRFSDPRMSLV